MQRIMTQLVLLMFMLALPMTAAAMSHEKHEGESHGMQEEMQHKGHDMAEEKMHHGEMEHAKEKAHEMHKGHEMTEGGMSSDDSFTTIGEKTEDGVKGTAMVMTYDAEKAAMVNATHHIMVNFTDESTGEAITDGKAALKIKGGDADAKPIMLMQMGEGFGADVRLEKGHYDLEIGTKFEDGKKRQFEFMLMNQ